MYICQNKITQVQWAKKYYLLQRSYYHIASFACQLIENT
jgi:hypothetical protein